MTMKSPHYWWLLVAVIATIGSISLRADEHEDDPEEVELSAEQIQTFLRAQLPEAVTLLERVRKEEPFEDYQEALERAAEFAHEYHDILHDDGKKSAEQFLKQQRLEMRIEALTIAWSDLSPDDTTAREAKKNELKALVTELFDHELTTSKLELKALQNEVRELEEEVNELSSNRAVLIDREMNDILDDWEEDEDEEPDDD